MCGIAHWFCKCLNYIWAELWNVVWDRHQEHRVSQLHVDQELSDLDVPTKKNTPLALLSFFSNPALLWWAWLSVYFVIAGGIMFQSVPTCSWMALVPVDFVSEVFLFLTTTFQLSDDSFVQGNATVSLSHVYWLHWAACDKTLDTSGLHRLILLTQFSSRLHQTWLTLQCDPAWAAFGFHFFATDRLKSFKYKKQRQRLEWSCTGNRFFRFWTGLLSCISS